MIKIRFFRSPAPRQVHEATTTHFYSWQELLEANAADDDPYIRYLCGALSFDFVDVGWCDVVLDEIGLVRSGNLEKTDLAGDAFFTEVFKDRAEIQHVLFMDYGWKIWVCDPEVFEIALRAWKKFLELPHDEENEVIVELPSRPFYYKDA